MAVLGTAVRRDIQLAASAITNPKDRYQKRELNKLAERAIEAAKGSEAATTGTALHTFTEQLDRGQEPGFVPEEYLADLAAYAQIRAPYTPLDIEGFCVRDDLRVGGSYDRIVALPEQGVEAPAWWQARYPDADPVLTGAVIWDLKTGGSLDGGLFGMGKIAMQMGVYANSVAYDHTLGTRSTLPGDPRTDIGIVCHLPAGTGTAQLLWVDLAAGWEIAYEVAPRVHAWRKRDDLSSSFASATARPRSATIHERIAAATSYEELKAIYDENQLSWTVGLTSLAAARRSELESAA
jgi:hypothetical protein